VVMWVYVPERRMRKAEAEAMPKAKECLACGSLVLRLAERRPEPPYQWIPNGYICSSCNAMFMGVM
jgi:ribosomal protein L40E